MSYSFSNDDEAFSAENGLGYHQEGNIPPGGATSNGDGSGNDWETKIDELLELNKSGARTVTA